MPGGEVSDRTAPWPETMTRGIRFEVIPVPGIVERVVAQLPPGLRVSITSSRKQGIGATLAAARELAAAGFAPVPHLAARQIADEAELERILAGLEQAGVQELFLIAGDTPHPAGDFEGSEDLLAAVVRSGHSFLLGVGAYPEGHPYLPSEADAFRQLREKSEHASYLVTQLCFDADTLLGWVLRLREHEVTLPVRPGIAAPTDVGRLLRIGARVGVGSSLRMLTSQTSTVRHLAGPGGWDPGALLDGLGPAFQDPRYGFEGLHVYTFNAVEATATWWREGRWPRGPGSSPSGPS